MSIKKHIPFVYYADDFTGATDELAVLANAGANAILFVEPPTKKQLTSLRNINAIGIASNNRALATSTVKRKLATDFELIAQQIEYSFLHYKICSTFDSSPTIGSIGVAIDEGIKQLNATIIPIVGGHPNLGRYCVFGNLFASVGTGTNTKVHRVDRHPSMSKHPTTPALDSDLVSALALQTKHKIAHIDLLEINKGKNLISNKLKDVESEYKVVLLDAQTINHIHHIGDAITYYALINNCNMFCIGPSSVAEAFGFAMNKNKNWIPNTDWLVVKKTNPTIVFSGSCSVVTKQQIEAALQNGFEEIIIKPYLAKLEINKILKSIIEKHNQKISLIIHTGKHLVKNINPEKLGNIFGTIALGLVEQVKLKRIVFAGGDTSSFAAKAMGIKAMKFKQPYVQGAPICEVVYTSKLLNGLELNFKGGQVGDENYFCNI
jgi:3-oxoisoapionate kinase